MADILSKLIDWLLEKRNDRLLKRWGGIQTCPWCRQIVQSGPLVWSFSPWPKNPMLDVLTCGVCMGKSLWRFEMGMMFVASLSPPVPAFKDDVWFQDHILKMNDPNLNKIYISVEEAIQRIRSFGGEAFRNLHQIIWNIEGHTTAHVIPIQERGVLLSDIQEVDDYFRQASE